MFNWIFNSLFKNNENKYDITNNNIELKILNIKKAVITIENCYLLYKKKKQKKDIKKLYRILNKTNNNLLKYLKNNNPSIIN